MRKHIKIYQNGNVVLASKLKVPNAYTDTNARVPNLTMGVDGNIQRSTTLTYSAEETEAAIDKKLAIKDKLIEKLSARLDELEKRIK